MRFYRLTSSLGIGLAALLAVLVPPTGAGASDQVYTVAGVAVDVTAGSATEARAAAIAEGHQKALQALFRRLVVEQDLSRAPQLAPAEIEPLVRDFSVANERTSAVRYLADMTFRFKPASIRALLRQWAVRFAETQSRPMVVLPVADGPEGSVLWEEPNPWRQAWSARFGAGDLVPLLAPVGDLSDIATIDAARALAGDPGALSAIARRYNSEQVLISRARIAGDPAGGTGAATVANSRFDGGRITALGSTTYRQQAGEAADRFLARVADAVAGTVQRDWKARNVIEFGSKAALPVTAAIRSLDEWLAIRQRLTGLPAIESVQMVSLSRSQAAVNLVYFGSQQQLSTALAQKGLILSRSLANDWQLVLDKRVVPQASQ